MRLITGVRTTDRAEAADPASLARLRERLRAVVLLAGSLRPGELGRALDGSLLDLPIEDGLSILDDWQRQAEALAAAAGIDDLPVRVLIDRAGHQPRTPAASPRAPLALERDSADLRGTGGILRDIAGGYAPGDLLIVANAAQILVRPLTDLAAGLDRVGGDVSIIAHDDGTPVGLFLVGCGALAGAKSEGFVDFKEQVLPRLAAAHEVRVLRTRNATGFAARTLDGYLDGVRARARLREGKEPEPDPFEATWSPTFRIIEPAAAVDPTAIVHDSVVLRGGRIERGGAAVRSVIAPGGVVRAGRTVVDAVVGRAGVSGADGERP
jgi:hypothetical protein